MRLSPSFILVAVLALPACGGGLCDKLAEVGELCGKSPSGVKDEGSCESILEDCSDADQDKLELMADCMLEDAQCAGGSAKDQEAVSRCVGLAQSAADECFE